MNFSSDDPLASVSCCERARVEAVFAIWLCLASCLLGCAPSSAAPPSSNVAVHNEANDGDLAAADVGESSGANAGEPGETPNAAETEATSAAARDGGKPAWPCWRGISQNNVLPAGAPALAIAIPPPKPLWEVELGEGWSSPAVAEGRVFVTHREGDRERLSAFSADDGKPLWRVEHPVDFEPHAVGRNHGNGPKATPFVHGGRVYCLGIAGWLACFDAATSKSHWVVNFPLEFGEHQPLPSGRARVVRTDYVLVPIGSEQGAPVPLFGYTGSPTHSDDLLITSVGGQRGGTLMAFDLDNGKARWKTLDENVSYSSPVVATLAGRKQVVAMTGPRVVGLDASSGELLWSHPFQIQYDESISTPLVVGDRVLVTGDGHPLVALAISAAGTGCRAEVAWENRDLSSYLSSMTTVGEMIYGMADDGRFACVRLSDGITQWQGGDHGYYCSPVASGAELLALNERAELLLFAADAQQFRELGRMRLWPERSRETWTVPAVVEGRVFVRGGGRLGCWDLRR